AWAAGIALALAPLAGDALPAIPDLDATEPARSGPDPPFEDSPSPPPAGGPDPSADRGKRPPGTLIACLGLLAVAAVAVILVLALSGSSHRAPAFATEAGRTLKRLMLSPAGTDRNAFGAAAIVRPARGTLRLVLRGRGLPANQNDSYAVWLFNTPGDARLLGFISPGVGAAGTFSSGTPLPTDVARFRELIVTLETTSRPPAPGQAVLKAPLRLS
ncbi:MAG: anti-sigma factor, partial [Actinomycetota bacterium]|nr:anti-sigma factor [Actinomycetota bacterium]